MVYERIPWQDSFREPEPGALRSGLPGTATRLFDRARTRLLEIEGVRETLGWYGRNWCWCLEYRRGRDAPFALIVPSPADLQLAMRVSEEFLGSLQLDRIRRTIRDGLELAQPPFDTNWAVWTIQPGNMLDELRDLLDRKLGLKGTAAKTAAPRSGTARHRGRRGSAKSSKR